MWSYKWNPENGIVRLWKSFKCGTIFHFLCFPLVMKLSDHAKNYVCMSRSRIWRWRYQEKASPKQASREVQEGTLTLIPSQRGFRILMYNLEAPVPLQPGILRAPAPVLLDPTQDLPHLAAIEPLVVVKWCWNMKMNTKNGWHKWSQVFKLLSCPSLVEEMILNEFVLGNY